MSKVISGWAWHQHHEPFALEWCFNYDARLREIENKPAQEVPTRKRLFKMLREGVQVPAALDNAGAALDKALDALDKAWDAYNKAEDAYNKALDALAKAWDAYRQALRDHRDQIETLHTQECGCTEWNGSEIVFPK